MWGHLKEKSDNAIWVGCQQKVYTDFSSECPRASSFLSFTFHAHADFCDIYTDVNGVYTADPNVVKNAKKLDFITYDDMLKMANSGAKVLHPRSITTAKKFGVPIRVRSTFMPDDIGTLVAHSR